VLKLSLLLVIDKECVMCVRSEAAFGVLKVHLNLLYLFLLGFIFLLSS